MKIADIHTHILYGIDDGARSLEESMALIGKDYEQGVRRLFCTNHSYGMEYSHKAYHARFDSLKKTAEAKYPELSLYKGCEVLCSRDEIHRIIENIKVDVFPTMNGSKYVLVEFHPHRTKGMSEMSYCLEYVLDKGYLPIIAHVERYAELYDDPVEDMMSLKNMGCMAQVNLYSVEQDNGNVGAGTRKLLANRFLAEHMIDFVGTDLHNLNYKSPEASVGAITLLEKYGAEYADKVLFENSNLFS